MADLASYPAAKHLFAAYFHEDFALEGSVEDVLRDYAENETLDVAQLDSELAAMMRLDEGELADLVSDQFGCRYLPTADGRTFHDLVELARSIIVG